MRQIPECCPQTSWETGLGKARGEIAAPVEIGADGSPGLTATQVVAQTRCHVIPAGDALTRQICALPGLCRAGGSSPVMRGTGRFPNLLLLSLSFPFSWSGFLGYWGPQLLSVWSNLPPFSPPLCHCPAFPFPLCLPGTRWSVAGAELLALGCLHHWQLGLLLPRLGRWQAGQVISCKATQRKPRRDAFVSLSGASLSGLVFPGHRWVSGNGSSPGVVREVSDPPRRGLGAAGASLSCSGWMWAAESLGRGWIWHYSFEPFSDEQPHGKSHKAGK